MAGQELSLLMISLFFSELLQPNVQDFSVKIWLYLQICKLWIRKYLWNRPYCGQLLTYNYHDRR